MGCESWCMAVYDQNANRRYYLERGRCPSCSGKAILPPGQKQCPECQKKQRERYKAKRDGWKARGLCSRCGRETDGKHVMCDRCREKHRGNPEQDKRLREFRNQRKEAGKCVVCGVAWAEGGHTMCAKCLKKHRDKTRKWTANSGRSAARQQLRDAGLCVDCRTPTDGVHVYCDKCRERHADSARKYRIHQKTIREGLAWE